MVLSAYDELLLAAVSPSFQPYSLIPQLREGNFDWEKALRHAQSNRVGGFVRQFLESDPIASLVDDDIRQPWHLLQLVLGARAEAALSQTRAVCQLMQKVGVRPLLYKGVDFEKRYYPNSCPRASGDIDIIVAPEHAASAADALRAGGYRSPRTSLPFRYYRHFHIHVILTHPHHTLPVEVHWALDWPVMGTSKSIRLIIESAEKAEEVDSSALRPNPFDTLILMAIHVNKHVGLSATLPNPMVRLKSIIEEGGLVWLVDVLQWMQTMADNQDGSQALTRAKQLHAEEALATALRLAGDLDPTRLPEWARELAEKLPQRPSLAARLVYPDLSRGYASSPRARKTRSFLYRPLPILGFRPVRLLTGLLPGVRVSQKIKAGTRNSLST